LGFSSFLAFDETKIRIVCCTFSSLRKNMWHYCHSECTRLRRGNECWRQSLCENLTRNKLGFPEIFKWDSSLAKIRLVRNDSLWVLQQLLKWIAIIPLM